MIISIIFYFWFALTTFIGCYKKIIIIKQHLKKNLCIEISNVNYGIFIFFSVKFNIGIDICIGISLSKAKSTA